MWQFNWGVYWAVLAAILTALTFPLMLWLLLKTSIRAIIGYVRFSQSKLGDSVALGVLILFVAWLVALTAYELLRAN